MFDEWKSRMESMIESLEDIKDIHARIRDVEYKLLEIKRARVDADESNDDEMNLMHSLDEFNELIEYVELKMNQLDMRLSAIEGLGSI